MRVLFFGSGRFAIAILESLHRLADRYPLAAVITRPDRPARRGRKPSATPVRRRCAELGIESIAAESTADPRFLQRLRAFRADLLIVADFGEILKDELLAMPPIGAFNLHASLLPRHRGAAPAAHAILAGDAVTGVTLFRIERRLDAGPIVAQVEVEITPEETAGELNSRLSLRAAELLEEALPRLESASFTETPQDSALATMAPKLEKEMALIDWSVDPATFCRRVRAFHPWPVAHCYLVRESAPPERTSILKAAVGDVDGAAAEPGRVVQVSNSGFQVACGDGSVRILEIQRAGKVSMDAAAYLRGRRLRVGDRFTRGGGGDRFTRGGGGDRFTRGGGGDSA